MAGTPAILAIREHASYEKSVGPSVYTAGPLLDGSPPVWPDSNIIVTPEQASSVVEIQAKAGYDFVKVYDNLTTSAYDAIIDAATKMHIRVAGHVPPRVGLLHVLEAHKWSIEHLTGYFEYLASERSPFRQVDQKETFRHPAHLLAKRQALADWVETSRIPEIAAKTAKAGRWNVPTLVAWLNITPGAGRDAAWKRPAREYATPIFREWWNSDIGFSEEEFSAKQRGDAMRDKILKALHSAGARMVGTETPHPFVIPSFSVHEELANFVDAGFSPYEALTAATAEAAEFMGVQGEFGL
jgi:hypothetical protein